MSRLGPVAAAAGAAAAARRGIAAAALALLAAAPAGANGVVRDTLPIPELVWVVAIEGAPADSALRAAFERGLKAGFDRGVLRTERRVSRATGFVPGLPLTNRFHQLFGTSGEGAWQFQAAIEPVAGLESAKPVVEVTLIIHSPAMVEANARPLPVRRRLVATVAPASAVQYARLLGDAIATLGLEHMHRLLGDLGDADRMWLEGFERAVARATPGR